MRVVIFGAGGHARVIADMLECRGSEIAGLIASDLPAGTLRFGYSVIGSESDLPALFDEFRIEAGVMAVGDNWGRGQFVARIQAISPALRFIPVIHPSACIGRDVVIGEGTVIMAGTVVNSGANIGPFGIVNTKASLGHDASMGSFASLAPGVTIGGNAMIGDYSAVSLGASVIHRIEIGPHSVIGAGSVVVRDIPGRVVAFGVPAKVVRGRMPNEPYL
jgi:sugar O-acyltransferase (sialic acid O-acetyltransferase NeuD family)